MIVEDREKFIKNAKLNHIIVRYIFAKSLYAVLMATDFSGTKNTGQNGKNCANGAGFADGRVCAGAGADVAEDVLLEALASVVMNRFVFESVVMNKYSDMVQILTDKSVFDCWRDLRRMDAIDTKSAKFRKCLGVAKSALSGELCDTISGAKSFYRVGKSDVYGEILKPIVEFCGYGFY